MVRKKLSQLAAGLSGGLLVLCGALVSAEECTEGLVRITDCPTRASEIKHGQAGAPCPTGERVRGGRCANGAGHVRGVVSLLLPHGAGTHSADHGWAPPGRVQVPFPRPVAYQKWFPDPWTGQPVAYGEGGPRPPVVYMPTDTTQLGYYYQTVPRWHAYGGMIPPAPNPNEWHQDLCQLQGPGYGYCRSCRGNWAHPGTVVENGVACPQPTPVEGFPSGGEMTPTPAVVPGPTPAPVAPGPAAGLEKSAQMPSLVPVK